MRKQTIIILFIVSILFTVCSSSNNTINKYKNLSSYKKMIRVEQKKDKTANDYVKLIMLYHDFAEEAKNIDVTELMIARAEEIKQNQNSNATVVGYYGSLLTFNGRDSSNPITKMSGTEKGTQQLDLAISMDKSNIQVRLLRGFNSFSLPSFFKRITYAIEDFEFITTVYEAKKVKLPINLVADIYSNLGTAYKRTNETKKAITAWQKSVALAPQSNSKAVLDAKKQLEIYED